MARRVGFLLDEDLSPEVARIGRGLGLDVQSVHELGRRGLSDSEQLERAAADGRVFVTRNRDDFLHWSREFYQAGRAHAGILIVSRRLPADRPGRIAHALARWTEAARKRTSTDVLPPYTVDFLGE